jgi:hypothetical protein
MRSNVRLQPLRTLRLSVFLIAAVGCSPQVEQAPLRCQGELPEPVTLDFANAAMVFRSGTSFQNALAFSSSDDTCGEFKTNDFLPDQRLALIEIYCDTVKSGRVAIQPNPSMIPSAAIFDVPKGQMKDLPIAYAKGGFIEIDTVKLGDSWRDVGRVTGQFEVEFEGAPPISSSFDIVECKPICNE